MVFQASETLFIRLNQYLFAIQIRLKLSKFVNISEIE